MKRDPMGWMVLGLEFGQVIEWTGNGQCWGFVNCEGFLDETTKLDLVEEDLRVRCSPKAMLGARFSN
jgi:hypothetical protein